MTPRRNRPSRRNASHIIRAPRRPLDQPRSLRDFQRMFHDEASYADYMERVRWPDGFVCSACAVVCWVLLLALVGHRS